MVCRFPQNANNGFISKFLLIILLAMGAERSLAQDNYEIEVYESPTQTPGTTMVELHSNYTFGGNAFTSDGVFPTQHMEHETVEITHGFNSWFEAALYLFNAIGSDNRTTFVGSHLRMRAAVPEVWKVPVGLSLSVEYGFQNPHYCADDQTLEIRPIIDKKIKKWYFSFNPVVDKAFHGLDANKGFEFSPCFKWSYDVTKKVAVGTEYYASLGSFTGFDTYSNQQHQLFAAVDLDIDPKWELNFGYGLSFTPATANDIFKIILGHQFGRPQKNK